MAIARGKSPCTTWRTVTYVVAGITDAVAVVYQRMVDVLDPVVGIRITQPAGVDTKERILAEKQRTTRGGAERQFHTFVCFPIAHIAIPCPALAVHNFGDTM